MKIDDNHSPEHTAAAKTDRPDASPQKSHPRPAAPAADQVHLSPRAKEYQKARQALSALPDLDTEKIQKTQDRIHSGRYQIDADKLADRMIRDALVNDD